MSVLYAAIILTFISSIESYRATPTSVTTDLPHSTPCRAGTVTVNDCNKCVCTSNRYFHCISKPCNQAATQNINNKSSCKPNILYIKNGTACLCRKDGFWPHETCEAVFSSFQVETKDICEPNSYVLVDCNVCKCGPDGKINEKRCTKNKCKPKSRRYIKQNQIYGSCEAQNWYSIAPCQFCYCIKENKLVCNTGNNYSKKLQLGSYNLSICGKEIINDAINLIPNKERALRFGVNKTENELNGLEITTEYSPYIALNREKNENIIEAQPVKQKQLNNVRDSGEYYIDSDEVKAQPATGKEISSTKLPYEEDENNPSSDSENENPVPDTQFQIDIESSKVKKGPAVEKGAGRQSSMPDQDSFPHDFESTGPAPGKGKIADDEYNLGDVFKPYLPVLDKVFHLALRKSMVSVDAHSNCTPGSTTVFKCNSCFCMKNGKLLCTNKECK